MRLITILFTFGLSLNLQAQVYKTIDANGNVQYSDTPSSHSQQIQLEQPMVDHSGDESKQATKEQLEAEQQAAKRKQALLDELGQLKKDMAAAQQNLQKLEAQYQQCLSVRRIGIRDLKPCLELSGDEKQQCINKQPVSYKVSSPENCQDNNIDKLKHYLEKAAKHQQALQQKL